MDNSFPQNGPDAQQQPTRFFVRLPVINHCFKWLASLIETTVEEQEDAGVFLGGEGRERSADQET
jgi:hypothetical protein